MKVVVASPARDREADEEDIEKRERTEPAHGRGRVEMDQEEASSGEGRGEEGWVVLQAGLAITAVLPPRTTRLEGSVPYWPQLSSREDTTAARSHVIVTGGMGHGLLTAGREPSAKRSPSTFDSPASRLSRAMAGRKSMCTVAWLRRRKGRH